MGKNRIDFIQACKKFDQAILVTRDVDGELQSCPVLLADMDAEGNVWFAVDRNLLRLYDIKQHSDVCVTMMRDRDFGSITGAIVECTDAKLIESMWDESWRSWFAAGPSDRALALINLRAQWGEYWSRDTATRLKHFFPVRPAPTNPLDDQNGSPTGHLKLLVAE